MVFGKEWVNETSFDIYTYNLSSHPFLPLCSRLKKSHHDIYPEKKAASASGTQEHFTPDLWLLLKSRSTIGSMQAFLSFFLLLLVLCCLVFYHLVQIHPPDSKFQQHINQRSWMMMKLITEVRYHYRQHHINIDTWADTSHAHLILTAEMKCGANGNTDTICSPKRDDVWKNGTWYQITWNPRYYHHHRIHPFLCGLIVSSVAIRPMLLQ